MPSTLDNARKWVVKWRCCPPSGGIAPGQRCYVVTAISEHGLEGPMSAEACGSPIGGP